MGADGPTGYGIDVLRQPGFVTADSVTKASLLAVLDRVFAAPTGQRCSGPAGIAVDEAAAFADVHRRGSPNWPPGSRRRPTRACSHSFRETNLVDSHCHIDQCRAPSDAVRRAVQANVAVVAVTESPAGT